MFMRTHRIGGLDYNEVLESYRDPKTSQPKHRCVVRWRHGTGRDDIQSALQYAKRCQRSARSALHEAEQDVDRGREELGHAERDRPTEMSSELHALVRLDGILRRRQREEARAVRFVERLEEAEAGLARSGKVAVTKPTTTRGPPLLEMEGSNGSRWRVRKLERDGFSTEWHVEWLPPRLRSLSSQESWRCRRPVR